VHPPICKQRDEGSPNKVTQPVRSKGVCPPWASLMKIKIGRTKCSRLRKGVTKLLNGGEHQGSRGGKD